MKKILTTLFISLSAISFAGAQNASTTATSTATTSATTTVIATSTATTTPVATTTTLQCVINAFIKRDNAIIAAHDALASSTKSALMARRDGLANAMTITDKRQREAARKAVWAKFRTDNKIAHNAMKAARKSAWSNYDKDMKACGNKENREKNERWSMERYESDSY